MHQLGELQNNIAIMYILLFLFWINTQVIRNLIYMGKETVSYEVETIFKVFYTMAYTQIQKNIQILQNDNGREYFKTILGNFFHEKRIVHQSSCVDIQNKMVWLNKKINTYWK